MLKYFKSGCAFVIGLFLGWTLYVGYRFEVLEFGPIYDIWMNLGAAAWIALFGLLGACVTDWTFKKIG